MKNNLFFLILFCWVSFSYSQKVYVKNYYNNGQLKEEGWIENSIKTAYWKFYGQGHEPWGVFSETPYFDTIIDQTTIFFYDFLLNYTSTNTLETIDFETSIYPNPTIDKLNISINSETTNKFNLLIINNLGQKVITKNVFINQGTNQIEVIVNHLPKGNYYLIINNGEQTISKIFVKH